MRNKKRIWLIVCVIALLGAAVCSGILIGQKLKGQELESLYESVSETTPTVSTSAAIPALESTEESTDAPYVSPIDFDALMRPVRISMPGSKFREPISIIRLYRIRMTIPSICAALRTEKILPEEASLQRITTPRILPTRTRLSTVTVCGTALCSLSYTTLRMRISSPSTMKSFIYTPNQSCITMSLRLSLQRPAPAVPVRLYR